MKKDRLVMVFVISLVVSFCFDSSSSALLAQDVPGPDPLPGGRRTRISGRIVDCDGNPVVGEYVAVSKMFNGEWSPRDDTVTDENGIWRTNSKVDFHSFAVVPGRDALDHPALSYYTRVESHLFTGVYGQTVGCADVNCNFRGDQDPDPAIPYREHYQVANWSDDQFESFFVSSDRDRFASGFDFVRVADPNGQPCQVKHSPTCRIFVSDTTVCVNENFTFTTLASDVDDDLSGVAVYSSPTDRTDWTKHYDGSGDANARSVSFSDTGQYYLACNASDSTNQRCTGNPWCSQWPPYDLPGSFQCSEYWNDCGADDYVSITVEPLGTCVESGNKRSLALTYGRCDDRDKILENFPDHKYYTWGTGAPCDVERFVAMVWGGRNDYLNQIAAARQTIQTQPLNSRWVLGPNECDIGSQCNMSIREVAVLWKQMEDALLPYGAKLVFPVPTDAGADDDWIWKVVGMYRELYGRLPTVQRFALHAYMPPSGSNEPAGLLKEFIDRQVAKLATGGGQDNLDGPCGFGMQSEQCVFDTRSVFNNDGSVWESITANGRYYNYVDKKGRWTNGRTLTSVDRYKSGPCAGKADDECRFETRTVFDYQGGRLESITAYGKYYNFHNGDPWPSNGNPLANVPRYYEKNSIVGPCYYQTGDECRFDTRTVFYDDIGQRVESITAYGRFFNYTNGNPWSSNGTMLTDPKVRYISGPCAGKEGDECIFDSRTVTARPDGSKTESITAYGKYYNYTSGAAWASNGSSLPEVDRYDDVRIYKGAAFADQKYWLTEFATACWQNYSPLETRAFMQDALPWLDQHPGIERYFWFTNRIYGDEWWGAGWQSCGLINPTTNQLELHGRYYADK